MSNIKEYMAQVGAWERKFGSRRDGHRKLDLVKAQLRVCQKCRKARKRIHRHHRGHEYLFALLNEEAYAKRYIEFRDEDIVILCNRCHKAIHRRYQATIDDLNSDLRDSWQDADGQPVRPVDKEFLEPFRQDLIQVCNDWLDRTSVFGVRKKSTRGRK